MAENVTQGQMLPEFSLPSLNGEHISSVDLRGKKNLIVYFFDPECEQCVDFLDKLAESAPSIHAVDAEIIAVGGSAIEQLDKSFQGKKFSFPIVADADGHVWHKLNASLSTTIVTDRFGEIKDRFDSTGENLPSVNRLLDILTLAELECPECGIPTWRP